MSDAPDQKGPWALALGVALVGVVAFSVEGYRAVRRRLDRDDAAESPDDE